MGYDTLYHWQSAGFPGREITTQKRILAALRGLSMITDIKSSPRISWDIGTAYDFFISQMVLHNPENYGLRASWAAGVRSRLPVAERKFLEDTREFTYVSQDWVYHLPAPKDAATALWSLRQMSPEKRMVNMGERHHCEEMEDILKNVAARGSYTQKDVDALKEAIRKCEKTVKIKMVTN